MSKVGILITNTGTPDAPTPTAVRRYLREFLSDRRIVQLPRLVWLPILYGLILPFRSSKSAKLYQNIWTPQGSPMRVIMQELREKLKTRFHAVEIGMNYGNPSIKAGLESLRKQQVDKIIVLPLYPQFSNTTTSSTFDRVAQVQKYWKEPIEVRLIEQYATHPSYIQALAKSVNDFWHQHKRSDHLLISFHGIPERFVKNGDPYQSQCEKSAKLLTEALQLTPDQWTLCYQSQFGYDKWLKPSMQTLFQELPAQGVKSLDVICPGFSVDCLETLEEISIKGSELFIEAGGIKLQYIPALNAGEEQVQLIQDVSS